MDEPEFKNSLDRDVEKLLARQTEEKVGKLISQYEICDTCKYVLDRLGLKIDGQCEYCGIQLIGGYVLRAHINQRGDYEASKEVHTKELCKEIKETKKSVAESSLRGTCTCKECSPKANNRVDQVPTPAALQAGEQVIQAQLQSGSIRSWREWKEVGYIPRSGGERQEPRGPFEPPF